MGFPGDSVIKNLPEIYESQEMEVGRWLEESPGEGHGSPLQYSWLKNPIHRGAWWATAHGVTKQLDMLKRLSSSSSIQRMRNF